MKSSEPSDENAKGPRSVLRVLEILGVVASRPEGTTLTEIAGGLGLPKTSAFSLLRTLERGGYLSQQDNRYLLGTGALKLAASIYHAASFPRSARPIIEELARDTGETVMLGTMTESGDEVSYIDVIESEASLRFTVRTGNRRPLYSVASGKILLAFQPADFQRAYLAKTTFNRFTAATTTKADLKGILLEARRRSVVLDADGFVEGAAAFSSPCFNEQGSVTCSVSLAGPTPRLLARRDELEAHVLKAGEQISRLLGYKGPYPSSDI